MKHAHRFLWFRGPDWPDLFYLPKIHVLFNCFIYILRYKKQDLKRDRRSMEMEMMEFMTYFVWTIILPFIGWAIVDVINIPVYVRMCRETMREYRLNEINAGIQAGIQEIINNPEYLQIIKKNG